MYSVDVDSDVSGSVELAEANAAVSKLAQARVRVAKLTEVVEERRAAFQYKADEMPEYWAMKAAEEALAMAKKAEAESDGCVRLSVLIVYGMTGKADAVAGAKIKMVKAIHYDPDAATEWALAHMPAVLALDRKRFESAALALKGAQMPVEIVSEPKVYIDKVLTIPDAEGAVENG
jgi:hypothetical protein